jgi:hypothetical protein
VAVTASITSTPNITLIGTSTYDIIADSLTSGQVRWRRDTATSPFVHGAVEVGAVKDEPEGAMVVRVVAATQGALQTAIDNLLDAVSLASWTLSVSLDGTAYTWTCGRASYTVTFDFAFHRGKTARVALTFPRHPVPTAGPI